MTQETPSEKSRKCTTLYPPIFGGTMTVHDRSEERGFESEVDGSRLFICDLRVATASRWIATRSSCETKTSTVSWEAALEEDADRLIALDDGAEASG
ncbi:hypothetical protein NUW54_g8664 [Trametes sanguinea]|uniref:Uncharacterized protein n=1 Tax=Trametes sanguinea TaxID=158606 RepID=A0ACC1PEF9_9APHY|nr:hypothetical protein NUW54_g8664 [Trametes sanguinea]